MHVQTRNIVPKHKWELGRRVALSHRFENHFSIWLSRRQMDSSICFCIVLWCTTCGWRIQRKFRRNILIAFSNSSGYFLRYCGIKTWQIVLPLIVSCSVESETVSINFSYSVMWKSMVDVPLWMDSFFKENFVTVCSVLVENIGSLNYADLSIADTFHYMI